jgi:HlyD family secretion protein
MKRSRTWPRIVLTVVVVAAVAAGALYVKKLLSTSSTATDSNTELVTVSRGNVVASISPTGQVEAVHHAALAFDVSQVALLTLNVSAGQQVKQGDVLATLSTDSLELAVEQAQASAISAKDALYNAQNPYSDLDVRQATLALTQAQTALEQANQALNELVSPDLSSAQQAVTQAQYNLTGAQLNLQTTQYGSTVGKSVRDMEYTVAWHERQLRNLQAQLAAGTAAQADVDNESETLTGLQADLKLAKAYASTTQASAQDSVTEAASALSSAQADLATLQAGPDELELAQAKNKVAQAEYNLAKAHANADEIAAGPSAKDVQLAQARYDAAQATLAEAQTSLANATMVAPYDGTVVSVGAKVGDVVSSSNVIVTLADLTNLRVVASIDETEIAKVQVGMQATITFDSLSGQSFTGTVQEIPLEGTLSSNVVTYAVPISLEGDDVSAVLPGMTANISMETGRSENALVLPILAVQESDTGNVVTLADGSTTPVQLGIDDGQYVVIARGLNEGDQVLVTYQTTTTSSSGFGRQGGAVLGMGGVVIGR